MRQLELTAIEQEQSESDVHELQNYFRIAETIADLIGPYCEVVVHSFASFERSVVKIVNGHHTGREVGSPITDLGLKMLRAFKETGEEQPKAYFTRNKDGSLLKSSTTILRSHKGHAIGMLCVNINLSAPFSEVMGSMFPPYSHDITPELETFSSSAQNSIQLALDQVTQSVDDNPSITQKGRNKEITRQLFEMGIFEFKEAIAHAAEYLGITRHAIYKYIREFKAQKEN